MLNLLCPLSLDSSYGFLRLSVVLFYHRSFFIVHSLSLLPTSSAGGCLRQYKNRNILYSSDFLFYRTCCLLYFVMLHLCPQEHLTLLAKTAVYWLFSQNNRSMEAKRRPTSMGEMSIFSGLVYCADCGQKMYLCRCTTMKQKEYFNCSSYRKKKKATCTSHQITVEAVEHFVLTNLQRVLAFAKDYEQEFLEIVRNENEKKLQNQTRELVEK